MIHHISLNDEGREEFGHIFGESIPTTDNQPYTCMAPDPKTGEYRKIKEIFWVRWDCLSETQQEKVIHYASTRLNVQPDSIQRQIEKDKVFPIDAKWTQVPHENDWDLTTLGISRSL